MSGQLSVTGRNKAANALTPTLLSVHSADPGANGTANEVVGTTRQSATFGTATNGVRSLTNEPVFEMPQGSTAAFLGVWDTEGDFIGLRELPAPETFANEGGELKVASGSIGITAA